MLMIYSDRVPATPRRQVWRDGEQGAVIGECLRGVFAPQPDPKMLRLLGILGEDRVDRKPR